ncbi:hypothetical protein ACIRNY_09675 [Capnocytophaga canimorsus]|uniref:InlB B-repeat-containing protein n=1 Tax=Capnocytophaga canimorsus TaxID=28188 RepID=UPI00384E952B
MKKHIFLLVLTLVVAFSAGQLGYAQTSYATTITLDGQSIIKEKNGTTTTIGAGTVVQVTDLQEHILSGSSQNGNINLNRFLIKNGMVFDIRMPNNYTNIEKVYGKYTIHTDSQGTYLRFTGAGGFSCRYKTVVGGVQESRRIAGDVNYYGVLQLGASATSATQDAPTKIAVVSPDDARIGQVIGGFHYVSENYVLSVPNGRFDGIFWASSLPNQNNFINLHNNYSLSNMQIKDIILKSKENHDSNSSEFSFRIAFYDGSSNALADGNLTPGGTNQKIFSIKDERTVQYTLTTESHHPTWGTAQPATKTVNAGTEVTLQATPKTGYRFVGWAVGTPSFIVANDNPYQPAINENVRFIAVFEV